MSDNNKLRFIRKNGRIIPIKYNRTASQLKSDLRRSKQAGKIADNRRKGAALAAGSSSLFVATPIFEKLYASGMARKANKSMFRAGRNAILRGDRKKAASFMQGILANRELIEDSNRSLKSMKTRAAFAIGLAAFAVNSLTKIGPARERREKKRAGIMKKIRKYENKK